MKHYFWTIVSILITGLFSIFVVAACDSGSSEDSDTQAPTPSLVHTAASGSTITIAWLEAKDNSGIAGLTYKVVRSNSDITTEEQATTAHIVQDFAAYGSGSVNDTGLSAGTYYYNVIVKDEAENTALYHGDSAVITDAGDTTAPTPGTPVIPTR